MGCVCASWKQKKFDPSPLIERLEEVREVGGPGGRVTFRGFRASHVAAALQSALDFRVAMPESDERRVIADALTTVGGSPGRAGALTPEKVRRAITAGEDRFEARPEEDYVLVTSVSLRRFEGLSAAGIGGTTFAFDMHLPEPFRSSHAEARTKAEEQRLGKLPREGNMMHAYAAVRASASGRSHEEAKEKALDGLDLLRGIWNLGINRYIADRTHVGIPTSNNKVSLGPVHSLHHPDGRLADGLWLNPDYVRPLVSYRMDRDREYVDSFEGWVREELERIPYRTELEAVLRRYARALDRRDWDTSFVRLWGLLETLTDTTRSSYDKTEQRALFVIPEPQVPYHRQILRHLTSYRNRNVHAGYETRAILTLLFQLKFYVEALVMFHLSADPSFGRLGEAARLLDLPRTPDDLRERRRRIDQALKIREPD